MNRAFDWMIRVMCAFALTVCLALPAGAMYVEPAMIGSAGMTIKAGMDELPLRDGQGTTSGIVQKLKYGQSLTVWWNDGEGWAYVEVPGTGKFGWVCLANTAR